MAHKKHGHSNHMQEHAGHGKGHGSGGQRIDDHSFWAGGPSKGSVFPEGAHTKDFSSAEGAASIMNYEQTSEEIRATQEMAKGKVKSHSMKTGSRN